MPVDRLARVGVVIPAYNAELWLAQALDSVLSQSRPPDDVVVVDDGSTDTTAAVARSCGGPVRVVRQQNAGIGAARNRGIEAVRGDLVAMLDADDLYTPSSIATRLEVLRASPHVGVVFGHERRFTRIVDGAPVANGPRRPAPLPGTMLVRRSVLERIGPFPTGVRVAEGLDWLLRVQELAIETVTVDEQTAWRRVHGENNSLRHRDSMGEFARTLKASLDRRRATSGAPPATVRVTPTRLERDL